MAYEMRDGQGSLFKNDFKQTDNHPDYKGSVMVGGVKYELAAWIKEAKSGKKFMSLSAKPEGERGTFKPKGYTKEAPQKPAFNDDLPDFDSEVPF